MSNDWHVLDSATVERMLETGDEGLSDATAQRRLAEYGPNTIQGERAEPAWKLAVKQLRDPLIYVLLISAAVTLVLRDYSDTGVILVVVVINSVIGFVQESRARQAMLALTQLAAPQAHVIRGGIPRMVASDTLVPGDLVLLTSGSRVPADLRLVQARDLAADESMLTGESVAVDKTVAPLVDGTRMPGDQTNMAFSGTTVVHGRGRGVVVRTGAATELGRIAYTMRTMQRTAMPLQETLAQLSKRAGLVIIGLVVVVLIVGLARAMPPVAIFLTAVALAVSAIPEALPVVLTVTLAIGVRRMARRQAIVRSLPAVETLGSTTVIGSDKTGTLTQNQMTVRAIWAGGLRYTLTGTGYTPTGRIEHDGRLVDVAHTPALLTTLRAAVLASEIDIAAPTGDASALPTVGDPTEIALCVAAVKGGVSPATLDHQQPELDLLPFESERQFMVSLRGSASEFVEYIKGAPEVVLARCNHQLGRAGEGDGEAVIDRAATLNAVATFTQEGLRVLAVAYRRAEVSQIVDETLGDGFVLAGLVGMDDPVRPEAIAAIADAHAAGIRVLMLTGDHAGTALVVGRQLDLGESVLEGHALDRLSDDELDRTLDRISIYARVTPEHKLRIVQRLKARGEVVAVTGDGVNDAPALRAAHLGIAMGARGSDVAREAADMVLTDDNFATIVGAIEEGRTVFANIRKITFFLLSTAAGELLTVLTALIAGWPLPFGAAQILWINVVTDSLQVIALAFDPAEPGVRRLRPRPRTEGVLTVRLLERLPGIGILLAVVTLIIFWWTLRTTGDMRVARSVAVTQMVVLQFYHVFNCRSLDRSIVQTPLRSNPFLLASMAAVAGAHLAALYLPWLRRILAFAPLTATQWYVVLIAGLTVIVGGELDKWYNRRSDRRLG